MPIDQTLTDLEIMGTKAPQGYEVSVPKFWHTYHETWFALYGLRNSSAPPIYEETGARTLQNPLRWPRTLWSPLAWILAQ